LGRNSYELKSEKHERTTEGLAKCGLDFEAISSKSSPSFSSIDEC